MNEEDLLKPDSAAFTTAFFSVARARLAGSLAAPRMLEVMPNTPKKASPLHPLHAPDREAASAQEKVRNYPLASMYSITEILPGTRSPVMRPAALAPH